MAGPWWSIRLASRTVLDPHAVQKPSRITSTEKGKTYKSFRTLRSLESGTRVLPSSEGDIGRSGGSGSRFRGKIPGSRKAC